MHPDDVPRLRAALRQGLRCRLGRQRGAARSASRHRLCDGRGGYEETLSLITLAHDARRRLSFVFGADYRAPDDAQQTQRVVRQWLASSQGAAPGPDAAGAPQRRLRRRSDRRGDPYTHTWLCAGYVVSPSLFRMVHVATGEVVELTAKQAQFIALLLGHRDADGMPVYVQREMTRRLIFRADTQCRDYDNDIDRLVKFFREHFGRAAIATKRGYGHILRAESRQCSDRPAKMLAALAR